MSDYQLDVFDRVATCRVCGRFVFATPFERAAWLKRHDVEFGHEFAVEFSSEVRVSDG